MGIVVLVWVGCAPMDGEAARDAWLLDQHLAANQVWLDRDPQLVGHKFARMASSDWEYLRGSTPVWYADLARPDPDRPATAFLRSAAANDVLVVGDPHLENLSTLLPGEEPDLADAALDAPLVLEWIDLDAAGFGAWTLDLRRAAMAYALFAGDQGCRDDGCDEAAATALIVGYAGELVRQEAGLAPWDPAVEARWDPVFATRLRADAREDGVLGAALAGRSELTAVGRRMRVDEGFDDVGRADLPLSVEESAQLDRLLGAWTGSRPAGLRVLDAVRRYGQGVSSLPAIRYVVLYDRGDDAPDDDRLVAFREVAAPPPIGPVVRPFDSSEARVREVAAALWSRPDADVRADAVADGALVFKVLSVSGWGQTFDVGDMTGLVKGDVATDADLLGQGELIGRALAAAHARGHTGDGLPSLPVLLDDLDAGGGIDALVAELVPLAVEDAAGVRADRERFVELREREGNLLGARWLRDAP